MHLNRYGDTSKETIVLIHGIPGAAASWTGVVEALQSDHDIVVPDLLGFGKSPRPSDVRAEAQAAALEAALETAGVRRAMIVGHDFGGPISLSLYGRRPELFTALVLMATNVFPDTPIPFPLSLVTLPGLGNLMARGLFSPVALKVMLRRYRGTNLGDAETVRRIFTVSLQNLDSLYRRYPGTLRTIQVPTGVIWGDQDPFFPIARAQRTAALIPADRGELCVLEGAGHFLPEERPVEVSDSLAALASRVRLQSRGS